MESGDREFHALVTILRRGGRSVFTFPQPTPPAASAIIGLEMSKVAAPKAKPARRVRGKGARIKLTARRRRSKAEDRLDGAAATKALREATERIPYQKARRDLDL
jgi:hypothetical protein